MKATKKQEDTSNFVGLIGLFILYRASRNCLRHNILYSDTLNGDGGRDREPECRLNIQVLLSLNGTSAFFNLIPK
jgi:hypothetical protein